MKFLAFRFEYQECNYYATADQKIEQYMIQISQFAPFSLSLMNQTMFSKKRELWIRKPF